MATVKPFKGVRPPKAIILSLACTMQAKILNGRIPSPRATARIPR